MVRPVLFVREHNVAKKHAVFPRHFLDGALTMAPFPFGFYFLSCCAGTQPSSTRKKQQARDPHSERGLIRLLHPDVEWPRNSGQKDEQRKRRERGKNERILNAVYREVAK